MRSVQNISLREATESDSSTVYDIKKAAFSHYVKKQYGDWDEAEQRNYHQERFVYQDIKIIVADHNVVGFVSVVNEANSIIVNQLMIMPKHQGKRIGEHCMTLIRGEAQRLGNLVSLQVMKVNPRAMKFYQRIGFIVTGETKTHHQMESTVARS